MTGGLHRLAGRQLPRMLTQVARDPGSPFRGCWDRNWWHYKIRDFPSIILQQGGYALGVAADLPVFAEDRGALRSLAAASARFWDQRARRHGAFEEYYPFEQGYPPLAFGTLAVAKLADAGLVEAREIRVGLERAISQLLKRFEAQAANQQVAGTAAVAVIRRIAPELVPAKVFDELTDRTLALQQEEGWFPEYDGPDLGYLAVTMDCLWDLHDATGDPRFSDAIGRAFDFIAWFVDSPLGRAGMHNARNTDYLVPYAIARLAVEPSERQSAAARIFAKLFADADRPDHFLAAVDDRYWCHYIGHSVFRALRVLASQGDLSASVLEPPESTPSVVMPGSGHVRLSGTGATALVSTRKGGVVTAMWEHGAEASDFGWIVRREKIEWVSHWWSTEWRVSLGEDSAGAAGTLVSHREHLSSPLKHAILRMGSWVLGCRMIRLLKRLLIFKKAQGGICMERSVHFDGDCLVVLDRFDGLTGGEEVVAAPRSSKRHVASADSFHPEDFHLLQGVERHESRHASGSTLIIKTRYQAVGAAEGSSPS